MMTLGLAAAPLSAQLPRPKLLVVISVDQLSADLFAEYRQHFTGGLKRMSEGVVFPSGYQSHAATETCPGHSTILTGSRPYRTGIIANDWLDQSIAREDKTVYCSEDVTVPGSTSRNYTVSARHLLVPTLGERMKAANPASRSVSVSVKDRAAVMMGGHKVDQLWWWNGRDFVTMAGQPAPDAAVAAFRASLAAQLAKAREPMPVPALCESRNRAVPIGGGKTVGTDRFGREAGNMGRFRASPESDAATLALASGLIDSMKLGRGTATDIIAIGQSATDYIGHSYGTAGVEMCINLLALDRELGAFFDTLDRSGVDYAVALTADHGGIDLPERSRIQGAPDAQRVDGRLDVKAVGEQIGRELKLKGRVLLAQGADLYVERSVPRKRRAKVLQRAAALLRQSPLVEQVLVGSEIVATPQPTRPPETWSLAERARASYMPGRSGDLIVVLKQRVNPVADPSRGYVTTHGSFWDYDRRVPILFWWKGVQSFEQPLGVETVDIMPTLASLISLPVPRAEIDGKCLDLVAGEGTNCP
ncbi:alkaline phosphatase family protein [Sphingomonas sp.]|jgi:predicted AlkP superfamily pyrophosphatase or phosphodiesterase|uniref:alkaline phosphatase family protein n=1 Tax=Sphingomonas sp. TaxID=28214 RepID=UPI0039C9F49F